MYARERAFNGKLNFYRRNFMVSVEFFKGSKIISTFEQILEFRKTIFRQFKLSPSHINK